MAGPSDFDRNGQSRVSVNQTMHAGFGIRDIPAMHTCSYGGLPSWLLPLGLAAMGYAYGSVKADLPGAGAGVVIALMNERTIRAQHLWHAVNDRPWVTILYATTLVTACAGLAWLRLDFKYKLFGWTAPALPGLWYFSEMIYLGGKILTYAGP